MFFTYLNCSDLIPNFKAYCIFPQPGSPRIDCQVAAIFKMHLYLKCKFEASKKILEANIDIKLFAFNFANCGFFTLFVSPIDYIVEKAGERRGFAKFTIHLAYLKLKQCLRSMQMELEMQKIDVLKLDHFCFNLF